MHFRENPVIWVHFYENPVIWVHFCQIVGFSGHFCEILGFWGHICNNTVIWVHFKGLAVDPHYKNLKTPKNAQNTPPVWEVVLMSRTETPILCRIYKWKTMAPPQLNPTSPRPHRLPLHPPYNAKGPPCGLGLGLGPPPPFGIYIIYFQTG